MPAECSYAKIKDGFYLVTIPEVRENPWYLRRKRGQGTYVEIANDVDVGVYIAPWPFNKHITIEDHADPQLRMAWDEMGVSEVIERAYGEIMRRLAEEERSNNPEVL
jgi:hypothetical protein